MYFIYCTCCECLCIHWASREHSTSTEPRPVDSESVVYAFLELTKCMVFTICFQPALINVGTTCSSVVDVVLLCVAGSHPCQTYWGRRQHNCWEVFWTCSSHTTTIIISFHWKKSCTWWCKECNILPPVLSSSGHHSGSVVCIALVDIEGGLSCCWVTELQGGLTTSLRTVGHSSGVEVVGSLTGTGPLPCYPDTWGTYNLSSDISGSGRGCSGVVQWCSQVS